MGIREALRSLKRELRKDLDYLELRDGTRHYYDPKKVPAELWLEMMSKTYASDVATPSIRKILPQATEASLARFEEKYEHPLTWEVGIVGWPDKDKKLVRRILLDGSVRTFLLEGEAARERRDVVGAQPRGKWVDPNREDVHEINDEEEVSELLKVEDYSQ
jgi:hypothetical protein